MQITPHHRPSWSTPLYRQRLAQLIRHLLFVAAYHWAMKFGGRLAW